MSSRVPLPSGILWMVGVGAIALMVAQPWGAGSHPAIQRQRPAGLLESRAMRSHPPEVTREQEANHPTSEALGRRSFLPTPGKTSDRTSSTPDPSHEPDLAQAGPISAGRGATVASCSPSREICDGADNDCDGEVDEAEAAGCREVFFDDDADGFGASFAGCFCAPVERTAANALDCDDTRADVHPAATERCDGLLDNDCDGVADLCGALSHRELLPGELIVHRAQEHTPGLPDQLGEWFEVENRAARALDLMGLEVRDDRTDRFVIRRSLVLEPGARARLGRNGQRDTNGGVEVDYVYSDFILSDLGDTIELRSDGILIDRVVYDASGALLPDRP